MTDERPDPDILLRAIKDEEVKTKGGALRVFLGMSAGVGKTYAMLQAAQARQKEGQDVVIGIVECHGRLETIALTKHLPEIPRKKIQYKGVAIQEMDLDAILEKKPKLVLVDELAHTNAPGSRHQKRYQDVLELLDAGIDVYTTVNVQHLESRKDLVEQITGIPIRETVPDSILEQAVQIELIDITPNDLLRRLKEGKVYLGEKADHAAQNFFKPNSLTALREIALRVTAERVDQDLQKFSDLKINSGPWQTNERLMVAISHSPYSEKLIRATRRLAYNLEAPWIALHVDTGLQLNSEDQAQLTKNIELARRLNAEVVLTTETDILTALKRIARQKNVTQIVVGRPTRRWVRDLLEGGSLLERLVRESGEIDVHVLRYARKGRYKEPFWRRLHFYNKPVQYWNTFWFLTGMTLISSLLDPWIGYRAVGFIFLLGVMIVGMLASTGPVIFAALFSVITWNFFFIPPLFTFTIRAPEDAIMCMTFFVVASIMGYLTNRIHDRERIIREREARTNVLYEVLKDISSSWEKSEFLTKVLDRVGKILNAECGVLLKDTDGRLQTEKQRPYSIFLDVKESAVANWVFQNRKIAGWSTDTLSESKSLYLPLTALTETVGVFIFQPKVKRILTPEQDYLLHSIVQQLANALERHFVEKRLKESDQLHESEKIHQTLLNSISHEMRTPLTTVLGTASALDDEDNSRNPKYVRALAGQLFDAGDRLNRVIENLLDMSRLNSGVLALTFEWQDVQDLVGVTIKKLGKNLSQHSLVVEIPKDLPLVKMDFRLMEHALSNLLLNATTYSYPGTVIRLFARAAEGTMYLGVEDQGAGIPKELLDKVFDKFFRVPGTPPGGIGLGLSIVKNIVELHKGLVSVKNRPEGGASFTLELPLTEAPKVPNEES